MPGVVLSDTLCCISCLRVASSAVSILLWSSKNKRRYPPKVEAAYWLASDKPKCDRYPFWKSRKSFWTLLIMSYQQKLVAYTSRSFSNPSHELPTLPPTSQKDQKEDCDLQQSWGDYWKQSWSQAESQQGWDISPKTAIHSIPRNQSNPIRYGFS